MHGRCRQSPVTAQKHPITRHQRVTLRVTVRTHHKRSPAESGTLSERMVGTSGCERKSIRQKTLSSFQTDQQRTIKYPQATPDQHRQLGRHSKPDGPAPPALGPNWKSFGGSTSRAIPSACGRLSTLHTQKPSFPTSDRPAISCDGRRGRTRYTSTRTVRQRNIERSYKHFHNRERRGASETPEPAEEQTDNNTNAQHRNTEQPATVDTTYPPVLRRSTRLMKVPSKFNDFIVG